MIAPMLYITTWKKCFYYINMVTNREARINNSLLSSIKFRIHEHFGGAESIQAPNHE